MKLWSKSFLAAVIVGGLTFGTVGIVRAAYPAANPSDATISHSTGSAAITMDDSDWPKLRHAMEELRSARSALDDVEPRFHEHRAKAIEHAEAAIHECEACLDEVGAHYEH